MALINVGIVGLGRLGKEYAKILALKVKKANLIAASSIVPGELAFAKDILKVPNTYLNYEEMLLNPAIDLIFILSSTNQHANQMIDALEAGLHVFCEKPLAINLDDCLRVEKVALKRPKQLAVVGFVRRYDPSYVFAMRKVKMGTIGKPFLVKSQTVDLDASSGFQTEYVKTSGGIFHDYNVHDIDLARWFLASEIKSVYSVGGSYKHKAFAQIDDADNVISTCVFENGSTASILASRTAASGHDTYTEVVGTGGLLRIGRPNSIANVEIYDQHGARRECGKTFYNRFEVAFQLQIEDIINCVDQARKPEITLKDATQATRVAVAMTHSFKRQRIVELDQNSRILIESDQKIREQKIKNQ